MKHQSIIGWVCILYIGAISIPAFAKGDKSMPFSISSSAFADGAAIPQEYTCEGKNVSPELAWTDAPPNTKSFALICDDPDAPNGVWTHWVVYDIPSLATSLAGGMKKEMKLDRGMKQGKQDFGNTGYEGPCPPRGHGKHRYYFTLYALDCPSLGLGDGAGRKDVEQAMRAHLIAQARWMGTYERK